MSFFKWIGKKGENAPADDTVEGEVKPFILPVGIASPRGQPSFEAGQLTGKCLIASPFMDDRRFRHAVVFICGHSSEGGAMGLIVNHAVDEPDFAELIAQFSIDIHEDMPDVTMVAGGPVEATRGFVLHTPDYSDRGTQIVTDELSLSTSVDVLKAMAANEGPSRAILALGYTGWDAGQLERELGEHVWMVVDADPDLLFEVSCNHRWEAALGRLGVELSGISHQTGRA